MNGQQSGPFVRPERVKAQFQFQAFNVFNHAPLAFSSGSSPHCIDCSTTTTNAMRQLQFAARFTY